MHVAVVGAGAVGSRAARQLLSSPGVETVTMADTDATRADAVCASLGPAARRVAVGEGFEGADAVLIASRTGHRRLAELALDAGAPVVSVADDMPQVRGLLDLHAEAVERGLTVVVGAGFCPGLTDVLAAHAATAFDEVLEIHVTKAGTGGPACARAHHDALAADSLDWREGAWSRRQGGSGRELVWFPDPVGGLDCYRAGLPDALLLQPAWPGVRRITARVAATRRDRFTARLPMLRPPHPEGMVGAVRVEVRGLRGRSHETDVLGAMDRPGVAAGAVAALACTLAAEGQLAGPGAGGLATLITGAGSHTSTVAVLAELARRGVKCAMFEGSGTSS